MSDETDEVAVERREAEAEHDRRRTTLLMDVAQDEIAKDPVMRASSQTEGGFFVVADPDEVAFFECMFKRPVQRGFTLEEIRELKIPAEKIAKGVRENFGFRCRPITMGMIGGSENWL